MVSNMIWKPKTKQNKNRNYEKIIYMYRLNMKIEKKNNQPILLTLQMKISMRIIFLD